MSNQKFPHIEANTFGAQIYLRAPISAYDLVSEETRQHEQAEVRAILADGDIKFANAVRADINRYHSGPHPVMATNFRAVY